MPSEYVLSQHGFFAVGAASAPAAAAVGPGIWCSPGMSSAYLVVTDAGRIVVNTGMWFEPRSAAGSSCVRCPAARRPTRS